MIQTEDKSIALGHPSYVWRQGQDRRLGLVLKHVDLHGKRVLDVGCGIGAYLSQFLRFTPRAYGVEVDMERLAKVRQEAPAVLKTGAEALPFRAGAFDPEVDLERLARARQDAPGVLQAVAESLPFKAGEFDMVFLHEVLEHVQDDAQALAEACRVLRPGGRIVLFVPNRLYPLETHGFYLGQRYVFRLAPLINYLPSPIRRRLVPHARCYLARDLRRLMRGLPVRTVHWSYVYPGFDSIASRRPRLARALRGLTYALEETPLRAFGLSHLLVVEKTA